MSIYGSRLIHDLEKYMKKLIGNTEIEDSLEKLDKLTVEEARMASAELLEITHRVDDRVKGVEGSVQDVHGNVQVVDNRVQGVDNRVQAVDDRLQIVDDRAQVVDDRVQVVDDRVQDVDSRVQGVDNKVQGIDSRVQGVDNRVQDVDSRVQGVDNRVQDVDNRVQGVDSRIQGVDNRLQDISNEVQDVDNKLDQVNRSLFLSPLVIVSITQTRSQGASSETVFYDGFHPQTRPPIITLRPKLIIMAQLNGFSKAVYSINGSPLTPSCGYTENVRNVSPSPRTTPIHLLFILCFYSWFWEKCCLVRPSLTHSALTRLTPSIQFLDHTRYHGLVRHWEGIDGLFLF